MDRKVCSLMGYLRSNQMSLGYTYRIHSNPWIIKDQLRHMALVNLLRKPKPARYNLLLMEARIFLFDRLVSSCHKWRESVEGWQSHETESIEERSWTEAQRNEMVLGLKKLRNGQYAWHEFFWQPSWRCIVPLHQLSEEWDRSPQQPFPL